MYELASGYRFTLEYAEWTTILSACRHDLQRLEQIIERGDVNGYCRDEAAKLEAVIDVLKNQGELWYRSQEVTA